MGGDSLERPWTGLATLQAEANGAPVQQMECTVVIPTFNSASYVQACLASVQRCLPDAEVIVVDNDSTDETRALVQRAFPRVMILYGHGNMGFGFACNLGTAKASNDYVLYLNPDAELISVDLDRLNSLAQDRPFGMLAGMIVEDDDDHPRSTLRRQPDHWLVELFTVRLLGILSRYAPKPRYVERVEGRGTYTVGGAVCLVATEEFRSLGGFDERFFMYYEDTDLTRRYAQNRYPLIASSAILATHVGGASVPTPDGLALGFLGWLEYVDKWHGRAAAVRAARTARAAYSTVLAMLRPLAAISRSARARAKVEQLSEMMVNIAREGSDAGTAARRLRYPAAAVIAGRTFRRFLPDDARAAS
jgi:N-acetylglucosaminyl-diphospho-decaprenol L-rhamnosyltransferase